MTKRTVILLLTLSVCLMPSMSMAKRKKKKKPPEPYQWEEITDADWSVRQDTADGDPGAVMIFERIIRDDTAFADKGQVFYTVYRRIRVLTDDGRSWADYRIPVDDPEQRTIRVEGRTILPHGDTVELQKDQIITTELVKTRQVKVKQTSFSLPGVTDDCIVDYVYQYRTGDQVGRWKVQKNIRLLHGEFKWVLRNANEYSTRMSTHGWIYRLFRHVVYRLPNYAWQNADFNTSRKFDGSMDKPEGVLFKAENVHPLSSEPFSLPSSAREGRLLTFYASPGNSFKFWQSLSTRILQSISNFFEEEDRLVKVMAPIKELPDDQKIAAAYSWIIENLKVYSIWDYYENFEESKFKRDQKKRVKRLKWNESANDLLKRGYGLETEIEYLFYRMLRHLDVDAKLAGVVDVDGGVFDKKLKLRQFHRYLIVVPESQYHYSFYSIREPFLAPGKLPWFVEGGTAMLLDGSNKTITIPYSEPDSSVTDRQYEFDLDDQLILRGSVQSTLTGHDAWDVRRQLHEIEEENWEKTVTDDLKEDFGNAEPDSVTVVDVTQPDSALRITCYVEYPALSRQGSRMMFKPLEFFSSHSENPFTEEERRGIIQFPYAYKLHESGEFRLPEGWQIEALPPDTAFQSRIGACSVKFQNREGNLYCERLFRLDYPSWNPEDYGEVRELFVKRQEFFDQIVVLAEN
ncbi:MAG: DUF3857 domain-containing protein [Candidatus Zixiibacteriota bacterium]|nr:MAG: DUF3857 domain-containing protein [candidate division Zixibacteria bacterium]